MGLCSSNQKRLAVTAEQHQLRELRTYSDTQARAISDKNAKIIEQREKIEAQNKELVQTRETLKRATEHLKVCQDIHESREQRHLESFRKIVCAVSEAARDFTELKHKSAQEANMPALSCRPEAEPSLSPLQLP